MKKTKNIIASVILVMLLAADFAVSCSKPTGPATYTVTFNSNGGTAVSPITGVAGGYTVAEPAAPAKPGYAFGDWYTDTALTADFDFSTPITANIMLYAKWTYNASLNVGEEDPGGGIIFYRPGTSFTMTDTGEHCYYLEAAPADQGQLPWSPDCPDGIGADGTAIGAGRKNTAMIIAACPGNTAANNAAKACAAYSNNGKTDWFLPSQNEIIELYKESTTVGGFITDFYWTSLQGSGGDAYLYGFNGRGGIWETRNQPHFYVRAIRSF